MRPEPNVGNQPSWKTSESINVASMKGVVESVKPPVFGGLMPPVHIEKWSSITATKIEF
jgi:hypothetical protein